MSLSTQFDYNMARSRKDNLFANGSKKRKSLSSFFVALFCLFTLMLCNSSFAQFSPKDCGNIQCTSNDVRVIRSYVSGPNNSAINCNALNPFDNAELHLIVSSNTQRIGVSISGTLTADGQNFPIGQCFGVKLNNGSDNNLVYPLGSTLSGTTCGTAISLGNVFTSWGTGNTNFCSSNDPQCPATPAKCRYAPTEIIVVDIKLAVDFSWQVGNCSSNTRSVSFTSALDLGKDVDATSITYAWDFDNNGFTDQTTANPTYPFAPGTYPVTLTVNAKTQAGDAIPPKSITRNIVIEQCCSLAAPTVSAQTFCSVEGKKLVDLNPAADGGYFSWFDGADPATSFEVDPNTIIPVGTNTYWISYSKDGCESGRTQVTITVKDQSALPTVSNVNYCKDQTAATLTATGSNLKWYTGATDITGSSTAPTPSTATVGSVDYYVTQTEDGKCESARAKITVTVNDNSALPTVSNVSYCKNQTASALTATGSNLKWYTSTTDGISSSTAPTPSTATVGTVDYYVTQTEDGKCESARTKITVTVNDNSTLPSVTNVSYCKNQTASALTAIGSNLKWYANATDGTGSSTAPTPSTATVGSVDYYVTQTEDGKCESARTKITVTVNPLPSCTFTRTDAASSTSTVGATASFSGPTPTGTTYNYAWSLSNNTSGASFVGGVSNTQSVSVKTSTVGSYTLSLIVRDNSTTCSSSPSCTYTVTVNPVGPFITYTQGFYGNSGGKTCNTKYSYQVMNDALLAAKGSIRFGNQSDSRSFTLVQGDVNNTTKSNIYKMLPGGTTPSVLKPAVGASTASYANSATWPAVPMSPSINNILLAQTMTLNFNIYYSSSITKPIERLVLTGNVLTFVKPTTSCGSIYPTTGGTTQIIPCSVYNYLIGMNGGATIGNMLILANKVLGGEVTSISPGDMNNAVDIINRGFDGGGQIIKVSTSCTTSAPMITQAMPITVVEAASISGSKLSVSAFPNPYTDKVKFVIQSPVAGQATLDVFNMLGQKIKTVFQGQLVAGIGQSVEYNVPKVNAGNLMYILRVGNNKVTGKLIH